MSHSGTCRLAARTQLHRFEQELLKAAQEARSVVVVEAERGKRTSLVKGTRREEQVHAEQHELASTGEGVDHFPALKFYTHPLVPEMARRLRAKGYTAPAGYNAKHLAVEIGAKIAAGKYRELGITPEQAFSVMNHYRGLLERTHGSARASRIVEAGYNSLRRAGYGKPNQKLRKGQNLLGPGQSRSGGELQPPDEGRGGGRGDRDARGVEPDLSKGPGKDAGGKTWPLSRSARSDEEPGLLTPEEERTVNEEQRRSADKLLGEQLTTQIKSGSPAKPAKLKPAKNRGLFDEPEEESGTFWLRVRIRTRH
jgi:hypothetical protein